MSELHNVPRRWISKGFSFSLALSPASAPQVKQRRSCTLRMSPGAAGASSKVAQKKKHHLLGSGLLIPVGPLQVEVHDLPLWEAEVSRHADNAQRAIG